MRFSYYRVIAKLVGLENVSCVIDYHVQVSEVLNLLLKVGLAFFTNIVFKSVLGMDIVTRKESNIKILSCVALLRAIDQRFFRHFNAVPPSFWVISDGFKLIFECFTWWCEILPVCLIALVVCKMILVPYAISEVRLLYDILDEGRVVSAFITGIIFYREGKFKSNVIQVDYVVGAKDSSLRNLNYLRVSFLHQMNEFETAVTYKDDDNEERAYPAS